MSIPDEATQITAPTGHPSPMQGELASREARRVKSRRRQLNLEGVDVADGERDRVGLALSGGGIRSATFCFGVLQALVTADLGRYRGEMPLDKYRNSVLSLFDYLSTVSGGGYIGGFLCSLFLPDRLSRRDPGQSDEDAAKAAAKAAYNALAQAPPGRIHEDDIQNGKSPAYCATAWLRDNGRYLTPTGAGDSLYALATTVRNWFAVHYVLGTIFLVVFSLLSCLRALAVHLPAWAQLEQDLLERALPPYAPWWWSTLWLLVLPVFFAWMVPAGIAYWLTYPDQQQTEGASPNSLNSASVYCLIVGFMLTVLYLAFHSTVPVQSNVALFMGGECLLAWLFYLLSKAETITATRVRMTRWCASGFGGLAIVALVAMVDTAGQSLFLWLRQPEFPGGYALSASAVFGAVVWMVRWVAALMDEKGKSDSFITKIPLNLVTAVLGIAMILVMGALWRAVVEFISWSGAPSTEELTSVSRLWPLLGGVICSLTLTLVTSKFTAFINLSALQSIYAARLTRAYLGASNRLRFESKDQPARRSAAEPTPKDQIQVADYYKEDTLAPLHIINVTINQTIDPSEQLVQRDRKGRPLAIVMNGYAVDGSWTEFTPNEDFDKRLDVGKWIGISGAAVSTGLGRATSFGTSLVLGLANVRLGMWWPSGGQAQPGASGAPGTRNAGGAGERPWTRHFRVQSMFVSELMARFDGMRKRWQYLSDGGHFENTGIYELLRRDRNVDLIVACDCGCDPDYRFGDIANLIRLARIDHFSEVEVDRQITEHPVLGRAFGTLADFRRPTLPNNADKCALLLNVFDANPEVLSGMKPDIYLKYRKRVARIIVLKPRVIAAAPIDVCEYQARNPSFPQQSTADQFFDEAQWESYRVLGFSIGTIVFGTASEGGCGPALWEYLRVGGEGVVDRYLRDRTDEPNRFELTQCIAERNTKFRLSDAMDPERERQEAEAEADVVLSRLAP